MGQAVSYLLRCICGEAEKEEKLRTCPLKSNSSSKSWIDSSSATIQVSDETTQKGNACSDSNDINQALQPDHILLVAPPSPTLFPSIDPSTTESLLHDPHYSSAPPTVFPSIGSSSTGGRLLDEVCTDTLTDFPSIDSSTDEKLPHGFFVLPPTFFPNINSSSTGRTLFHEVFVDPPTDVASVDLSTDEALLHHELFVAPSTYVPSLGISNDQALLKEILVNPSTDIQSIGCSSDEALLPEFTTTPSAVFQSIDQFKVTDSNIQVVKDKMQVHPPNNENVKMTKERSEEESKEAKPRKGAAVVIERMIKHYSSSQKILLVGEGDFSFSACLARAFGSASNIVATSLDSTEFLFENYKKAQSNISELMSRGAKVYHGVDATDMAYNYSLNHIIFDRIIYNFPLAGFFPRIIYNFPLAGFFPNASEKTRLKRNRGLIVKFFKNAMELISEDGEIHIAHKSWGFFLEWNLPLLASHVGLRLTEEVPFNLKDYKGYKTKYGFGGDRNFDCNPSKTYKFGFKTRKTAI